jgi:hypothetical protein
LSKNRLFLFIRKSWLKLPALFYAFSSELSSEFSRSEILGLGHVLNGKSSGTVYHLIFERHFITLVCQLIGLDA